MQTLYLFSYGSRLKLRQKTRGRKHLYNCMTKSSSTRHIVLIWLQYRTFRLERPNRIVRSASVTRAFPHGGQEPKITRFKYEVRAPPPGQMPGSAVLCGVVRWLARSKERSQAMAFEKKCAPHVFGCGRNWSDKRLTDVCSVTMHVYRYYCVFAKT